MPIDPAHMIHLENGRPRETSVADIQSLVAAAAATPLVAVHFHGGLVNKDAGLRVAAKLGPRYTDAGAYPVFFIWEAGLRESLVNNLREITDESLFKRVLLKVLQFGAGKLLDFAGGRGTEIDLVSEAHVDAELAKLRAGLPAFDAENGNSRRIRTLSPVEQRQFERLVQSDIPLSNAVAGIAVAERGLDTNASRGGTVRPQSSLIASDLKAGIAAESDGDGRAATIGWVAAVVVKRAVQVVKQVISRLRSGRDHGGLYATAVEEILRAFYLANAGQAIWSLMKTDTGDAFKNNPDGGGKVFVDAIKTQAASGNMPRYVLIGHSTGAVFICNLLKYANTVLPPNIQFDVIFLAPACTYDLLNETLATAGNRIAGFRMFAMSDDLELKDELAGKAYPHSLLYFVSGVVEPKADMPIVGMERFALAQRYSDAKHANLTACRTYFAGLANRTLWSPVALGDGLGSSAASHSAFDDNDEATTLSMRHILKQGF